MEEEYKEYKHLLEEMPDLFAVMQDDRIVFTNSWTAERYGYSKDELIGKPVMAMIAPEERERVLRIIHQDKLTELETLNNYQTIFLTKYGTKIPVEVTSWITQYRGRPAAAGIARDISERKRQHTERVMAQEEAQKRLAQTLHDDTIQELLLITHRLKDIDSGTYSQVTSGVQKRLEEVLGLLERVINDVRKFTENLRPSILDDMGLVSSLRWLAGRLKDGSKIHTKVRVTGKERRLPPDVELALFRIAQEAMNNVRKHACASEVVVKLEFGQGKVMMSVSDDGKGFDLTDLLSNLDKQKTIGLTIIAERVQMLGGNYIIDTAPNKGTVIGVEISV